jgi:Tfp pilus assembly protein FimT
MKHRYQILRSEKGVSLTEIVATVAVIGLFLAVAIPSFSSLNRSLNKRAARESFEAFLRRAQATAIKDSTRIVLTSASGGNSYTMGPDYPPYNTPVNPDVTSARLNLPKNIVIVSSSRIVFDSRGQFVDASGLPTSASITMASYSSRFASASLYSTGGLVYN